MESDLNAIGIRVVPKDIFLGMGKIAKENTSAGVVLEASFSFAGRTDPNAGSKGAKVPELGFVTRVKPFESGGAIAFGGKAVFDPKVVVKSIWPEARVKVGAGEHGTESVTNSLVGAFNRAILM